MPKFAVLAHTTHMNSIVEQAKSLQKQMIQDRRFLHANAEVGFDLPTTKRYVEKRLKEMGIAYKRIGKSGIVALLGEKKKGGATLLRADMDALPILEESGETFSCKTGNMHACGHDFHTAILLGVARILKDRENALKTPVKLLFQPAEELLQGAEDCLKFGVLNAPKVKRAAALHVAVGLPLKTGTIILPSAGVKAPAADFFKITVTGKGCHGSTPQNGVDSLLCAAHMITALQSITTREIPSTAATVLTVGKIQGGDTGNAIAEKTTFEGTIRVFDEGIRKQMKTRMQEMIKGIAKSFRASGKIEFLGGCPCLVNHEKICAKLDERMGQVLDERMILRENRIEESGVKRKSGGSEDFAYIAQKVPSVFFSIVAGDSREGYTKPLHSPSVKLDENALVNGAVALSVFALTAVDGG